MKEKPEAPRGDAEHKQEVLGMFLQVRSDEGGGFSRTSEFKHSESKITTRQLEFLSTTKESDHLTEAPPPGAPPHLRWPFDFLFLAGVLIG